ncbi:MAG: ATP-binding protein [Anaerolineae bacterium]
MIERTWYLNRLAMALRRSPVVALLGARQVGKTTLARRLAQSQASTYFDLESQPDRLRLQNPELVLGSLQGLVVLDEIQTMPELYPVLRVLADRPESGVRFLVLGSASTSLVREAAETMAGRVEFVEMAGLDLTEVGTEAMETLWTRGGFPRAYLAASDEDSWAWREGFFRTFLERDIPQLGISIPAAAMRRFWTMIAHYHGQTWNASELARSLGLSDKTVRSYLDILTGTFMVRQLQPWYENIGKRQVRSPKVYFRDSGLLHAMLGLPDRLALLGHPKVGASWEGFVAEQVLLTTRPNDAYFWATHSGAELDLMFTHRGRRYGIEAKFSEAPSVTASMHTAVADLELEHLWVVHPGRHAYPVAERISVLPLRDVPAALATLVGDSTS